MRRRTLKFIILTLFAVSTAFTQGFKVKATGEQTFSFTDKKGRNQAMFFSSTPLEDVTGLSNDVKGSVTVITSYSIHYTKLYDIEFQY